MDGCPYHWGQWFALLSSVLFVLYRSLTWTQVPVYPLLRITRQNGAFCFLLWRKKKLISLYNCECYNMSLKVSPYLYLTNFRKSTNERLGHHSGNIGGKFQTGCSNQLLILGLKKSYRRRTMPFFNTKRAFHRRIRLEKKLRIQLLCPATWVYSLL